MDDLGNVGRAANCVGEILWLQLINFETREEPTHRESKNFQERAVVIRCKCNLLFNEMYLFLDSWLISISVTGYTQNFDEGETR